MFKCYKCNQEFEKKIYLNTHLKKYNLSERHFFIFSHLNEEINCDLKIKIYFLNTLFLNKQLVYETTITRFKKYCECYNITNTTLEIKDVNYFFGAVILWHNSNPKNCNNKNYCDVVFPNDKEKSLKIYEVLMKSKNPFTGHGGRLSCMSKNFKGYSCIEEYEEFRKKLKEAQKNGKHNSNQLIYWLEQGYDETTAKKKLKERQTTFSLEKCIEKFGKEDGEKRFKERQEKWQQTLNNKPIEEIQRINKAKLSADYLISSHEVFLKEQLNLTDENIQLVLIDKTNNKKFIYDFYKDKKIIEFHGDFWHCNPMFYESTYLNKRKNMLAEDIWKYDEKKMLFAKNNGYEVLIIWEYELKHNAQDIINYCKQWLNS